MKYKSNKHIRIEKDSMKSYVFIFEKTKPIGMLSWHYTKKKWVFDPEKR